MDTKLTAQVFETAVTGAGVGVWVWDLATNAVTWSGRVFEIYGLDPERFEVNFDSFSSRVHEEDRALVAEAVRSAIERLAQDYHIEHRIRLPQGGVRWVEGRGSVTEEGGKAVGMIGTVVDITPRKQVQERLRLFTEHASDYVYEAKVDGSHALPTVVAGSFERTTGYSLEQVEQLGGWLELIHPEDRQAALELVPRVAQGESVLHEYRIIRQDGQVRWLRDRLVPVLGSEEGGTRVVGGVTDITEQRRLEEQLASAQRTEAMARLAGGVAHDFNNLLTVMMAEVSMLLEETNPAAIRGGLAEVDATLDRASKLASSLLAFGRRQVGPVPVVDLVSVVASSESLIRKAVEERVVVNYELPSLELRVEANPNDIHLVLLNLALNAKDAMLGGGKLCISVEPCEEQGARDAVLRVSDTGAGIPDRDRRRVFEPFFSTKGSAGTGLGLPTCQRIARRYQGDFALESTSSAGTVFRVSLPLTDKDISPVESVLRPLPPAHQEKILLVEDDTSVRSIVERALSHHGYTVTAVSDAEAALNDTVDVADVDLLLTDVGLPGMSGLALVSQLRSARPELRVLVMSGHVGESERGKALSEGQLPFVSKPFSHAQLIRKVASVLGSAN